MKFRRERTAQVKRERGFVVERWMIELAAGLGVLLAVQLYLSHVESKGYDRGATAKQLEWDKANEMQAEADRLRQADVDKALRDADERADRAEREAALGEANWEDQLREARRNHAVLGSCSKAEAAEPAVAIGDGGAAGTGLRAPKAGVPGPGAGGVVHLHWRFVWLHDSAYAGPEGQSLRPDNPQSAGYPAGLDAASPYTLDDLIDVEGANAQALSACHRAYAKAIDMLDKAAQAWDGGQ